jgi:hypothetical protein
MACHGARSAASAARHQSQLRPSVLDLGKWGIPVNLTAVVMGAALCVNIAWARQEVYDPDGSSLVLQYFAMLFVIVTLVAGFFAYQVVKQGEGAPERVDALIRRQR